MIVRRVWVVECDLLSLSILHFLDTVNHVVEIDSWMIIVTFPVVVIGPSSLSDTPCKHLPHPGTSWRRSTCPVARRVCQKASTGRLHTVGGCPIVLFSRIHQVLEGGVTLISKQPLLL